MDKDQAYKILSENEKGPSFKDFPESLKKDPELARLAVEKHVDNIAYINKKLLEDRNFILDLVGRVFIRSNAGLLKLLPESYRSDREVVMAVMSTWDCESLKDASDELRNDHEVVWNAMFKNGLLWSPLVYEFAGEKVLGDKEFLDRCLNEIKSFRGAAKKDISTSLKNWHKLSLAKNKGGDSAKIEEIKITLKDLKKEVREASDSYSRGKANKNIISLISSISSFNGNSTLMKLLVELDYSQYEYDQFVRGSSILIISEKLMADKKFASSLMKATNGEALAQLPEQCRRDEQFIRENIGEKTTADSLDKKLRSDINFMLDIAQLIRPFQFKEFPKKSLWGDKDFVLPVVRMNGIMIEYASPELKKDREIALAALVSSPYSVVYADPSLYQDKEYMQAALETDNGNAIECLREPLISDVSFLLDCLSRLKKKGVSGLSNMARAIFRTVPLALRKNKTLILACLELNGWAIENVPEEMRYEKDILAAAFKSGAAAHKELDLDKLRSLFSKSDFKKMIKNDFYIEEIFNR